MDKPTQAMFKVLWAAALTTLLLGCGGDGGDESEPAPLFPPDSVSVVAQNDDGASYRLVVQTWDSSVWPPAVSEQLIVDPLPAFSSASGAASLATTSATVAHYFAIRDAGGVLLATSTEYVKGSGYQVAVLLVSGQAITIQ